MADVARERERELLGAALRDGSIMDRAVVEPKHFASPPYGHLWALLGRLRAEEGSGDWLSLVAGGMAEAPHLYPTLSEVMALPNACPSVELWEHSEKEVLRLSKARDLRAVFADLAAAAKRDDADPGDLITRAGEDLEALAGPAHKAAASEELQRWHVSEVLTRMLSREAPIPVAPLPGLLSQEAEAIPRRNGAELRAPMPSGDRAQWGKLGRILGAWWADTVAVIVGGTGRGKSSFAVQLAEQAAVSGAPVLYASMEMSAEELAARLIALRGRPGASWSALKRGAYAAADVAAAGAELVNAAPHLYLWAPASGDRNVAALQRMARAVSEAAGGRPPLVVLDYVQRLAAPAGAGSAIDDRRGAVSDLSGQLRDLSRPGGMGARWPGAAVVALSSTARTSYATFASVAELARAEVLEASGKESGDIEYDAPILLCMTSDKPAEGEGEGPDGRLALVRVVKNREGAGGRSVMRFHAARGRFVETDDPIPDKPQKPRNTGKGEGEGTKASKTWDV